MARILVVEDDAELPILFMTARDDMAARQRGICEKAGISRKTFQRHYASKDDIIAEQMRVDFVKHVTTLRDILPIDEMETSAGMMLTSMLTKFYNHRAYYVNATKALGRAWFLDTYNKVGIPLNRKLYEASGIEAGDLDYVSYIFCASTGMTLLWWMDEDFAHTPAEMARYLETWVYAHWREIQAEAGTFHTNTWEQLRDSK